MAEDKIDYSTDRLSKWETGTSCDVDLESQSPKNKIKFVDAINSVHQHGRNLNGSRLVRRLSASSLESSISRTRVEPSVVLPPLFKTVSYKIENDDDIISSKKVDKNVQDFKNRSWHIKNIDVIARELNSNLLNGLTIEQHKSSLKQYGENVHSPPPSNLLRKLFIYFFGGFGSLLLVGGILCCISWKPLGNPNPTVANLVLGVVLFLVFILQALFNFWQDFSSSRVMNSINGMLPSEVQVVRNGVKFNESAKQLVPGDLIFIRNGDRLPADIRFVSNEGADFAFDRSILTGESKPIYASLDADKVESNYLESASIGLQGTFCVGGSGYGMVISTGDSTVFGQIAKLTAEPKNNFSPLQKEIIQFVGLIVGVVIVMIVIVCIVWGAFLKKHYPEWITVPVLIVDLVSVTVAFIPEGLPIALTTCLIITANAMKRNKILCKSLSVVETLGSVSTICSDKTGTLTKNKMFVTTHSVGDEETTSHDIGSNPGLHVLSIISKLCNSATFDPTTLGKPINERLINGNATDQAILRFGEVLNTDEELKTKWTQKSEVSFNSRNKFMIRLFQDSTDDKFYTLMIKGAPDILLSRCSSYQKLNGKISQLKMENLSKIKSIQMKWAENGQRVVLLAFKKILISELQDIELKSKDAIDKLLQSSSDGLILSGLVGITDPPKDDIFDVVSTLKTAGIKVCMVTGDFEATAIAIAKKCGILNESVTHQNIMKWRDLDEEYEVFSKDEIKLCNREVIDDSISITGDIIDNLSNNQWENLINYKEIVFSRTTPEHKLRIVEEFQKRGHIVGMTGDGVNDAPSLKQADIGIAMAEGSDIAKEASDLILLESFSSLVLALKYGRLVFENLKKTISYLLPAGCYAELWAVILNVLFGFPQILSSFCMIMISCLTDCAGAITLAYEAPEKNLLEKQPRSMTGSRLVDKRLIFHSYFTIGTYTAFSACLVAFVYFKEHGIPFNILSLSYGIFPEGYTSELVTEVNNGASSVYFVTLVIMQFFHLMSVRTRYLSIFQQKPIFDKNTANYGLFVAIAFSLSVTFFFNYIPWFRNNLGTSPIPVKFYFIAVGFGCGTLLFDELRKLYIRKYPKSVVAKMAW